MSDNNLVIYNRYKCIEDFSFIIETPEMNCWVSITQGMMWAGWKNDYNDEYTTLERHHVYIVLNKEKLDKYFRLII